MVPSKQKKLTTVILNYEKASRVLEGVDFLLKQKHPNIENKIIVIDNSCNSKQEEILKKGMENIEKEVSLLINKKNLGYTKGYNSVKKQIEGEYVLILNPDILLKKEDSINKMISYMEEHPDVAILGPKQINDSGEIAMTVRAFPKFHIQVARRTFLRRLPFLKKKIAYDEMRHLNYNKVQEVDWLQSSCVLIRKDFWDKVGGFNEEYFLFMADTEMCLLAWGMNHKVVYYPETNVYADGKRLSAGGLKHFFKNKFVRQHVIDSLRYKANHLFEKNPRKQQNQ